MLVATIQFETGQGRTGMWAMTKEFTDQRHLDNFCGYIRRTKGYLVDEVWHVSGFPFNEGDTYFTIENGEVVESVWDDVSEELYDDRKFYTWNRKAAERYAEGLMNGSIINLR